MAGAPPAAPTRRPDGPGDDAFRARLFAAAHGAIFAGLDAGLADQLLAQQCEAQEAGYRARFPAGRFEIVEDGGRPVGRLVSDRGAEALTLVDVALLPEARGRGLGTALLRALMAEAADARLPLRLSVAHANAGARRLYARLGFRPEGGTELAAFLVWRAS